MHTVCIPVGVLDRERKGELKSSESNHGELAPGGSDGSVLDHDAIVWFGTPRICVFIGVVVQSLFLVVLIQLLLCRCQYKNHVGREDPR